MTLFLIYEILMTHLLMINDIRMTCDDDGRAVRLDGQNLIRMLRRLLSFVSR